MIAATSVKEEKRSRLLPSDGAEIFTQALVVCRANITRELGYSNEYLFYVTSTSMKLGYIDFCIWWGYCSGKPSRSGDWFAMLRANF